MFPERLLCDDSLEVTPDGFRVKVRVNWYRGVALSCVERLDLSVDGDPVAPEDVTIRVNGADHPLTKLADLVDEFWFVADPALVSVHRSGIVSTGTAHKVDVLLSIRLPYILVGDGDLLRSTDTCTKTLTAREGESR